VFFTDTLCCTNCEVLVCLLAVSMLLTVFLAVSVPFLTLLGSSVLTWHPAGLASVTCMLEEPISLQGGTVRGPLAVGTVFETLWS